MQSFEEQIEKHKIICIIKNYNNILITGKKVGITDTGMTDST